ncbi:MAG TPA: hypothetical protein PLA90_08575 [Candidatus Sumerlaeota bacterium]|nr:hypothetical protein [Candidatus Sumerlaeota bacterium]
MSFRRFFCEERWGAAAVSLLILAGLLFNVSVANAQLGDAMVANQDAMNNAGGTAQIGTGAAMGAARGVAGGGPAAAPAVAPAPAPVAVPAPVPAAAPAGGAPGAAPVGGAPDAAGGMAGGDMYSMGGTMMRAPAPLPTTAKVKAGRRVIDALSYRMQPNKLNVLDDVRDVTVIDSKKKDYQNAAVGQPSLSEYVDGSSFGVMQTSIGMLNAAQKMDPLKFFGVVVLSTEPSSVLPTLRQRVQARDRYVYKSEGDDFTGWAKRFLQDFRKIPEDPAKSGEFFALYLPAPPDPPAMPPPPMPTWKPPVYKKQALDRAIDAYMAQGAMGAQPGMVTAEGGAAAPDPRKAQLDRLKEIKKQLKDKDFRDQFMAQYGQAGAAGVTAPTMPGMGMGGYPGAGGYSGGMRSGG